MRHEENHPVGRKALHEAIGVARLYDQFSVQERGLIGEVLRHSISRAVGRRWLRWDKSVKVGKEAKRKRAGWDEEYLRKVFNQ